MCAALCILPLLPVHKRCALGPLRVMIALVAVVLLVCASTYCAPPVLCNTVVVSPIHTNVENTTSPTGGRPRPTPYGSAREGQERESDTHAISNDIYELPAYNCHHQLCVLLAFADFFCYAFSSFHSSPTPNERGTQRHERNLKLLTAKHIQQLKHEQTNASA